MTTPREMTKEELEQMQRDYAASVKGDIHRLFAHIAALEAKAEELAGEVETLREENKRLDAACGILNHDVTRLEAAIEQAQGQQRSDMAKVEHWRKEVAAAHLLLDRAGQSPVQPNLVKRIEALLAKCDEGWGKAASARDVALEEALGRVDAMRAEWAKKAQEWAGTNRPQDTEKADRCDRAAFALAEALSELRALKAQPARRFVDAAHISEVLSSVAFDAGAGRVDNGGMPILLEIARRLGVPVDEVSP